MSRLYQGYPILMNDYVGEKVLIDETEATYMGVIPVGIPFPIEEGIGSAVELFPVFQFSDGTRCSGMTIKDWKLASGEEYKPKEMKFDIDECAEIIKEDLFKNADKKLKKSLELLGDEVDEMVKQSTMIKISGIEAISQALNRFMSSNNNEGKSSQNTV